MTKIIKLECNQCKRQANSTDDELPKGWYNFDYRIVIPKNGHHKLHQTNKDTDESDLHFCSHDCIMMYFEAILHKGEKLTQEDYIMPVPEQIGEDQYRTPKPLGNQVHIDPPELPMREKKKSGFDRIKSKFLSGEQQ